MCSTLRTIRDYIADFHDLVGRKGVTPDTVRTIVRNNTTVIGLLAARRGEADTLIGGLQGASSSMRGICSR